MASAADTLPWSFLTPRAARALAVGSALAVAFLDAFTPSDYILPVGYAVPLVLSTWTRRGRFLWVLTLILVAGTLALFFWGPAPTRMAAWHVALINRLLAVLVMIVVAGLVQARMLAEDRLDGQRLAYQKQNTALEALNRELTDREEEIVRQNEELQAQTEELERQSEELRVTNEELAAREKVLEQLLELSRSLTADLPRDAMLKRICEALGLLMSGMASAILEKDGPELRIPCYHGFGPAGAQAETIPYTNSFTSLIMSLGQTGYLEDLSLRPDLHVPQPREGEPFRAVLASPLRVRGQCVGTIEVYASQRQTWSETQTTMLESLAAQASISLQSAELVQAIRQERRRFEAAFRTVPFGMAVAEGADGQHVRLNPAAAALFHVPLDENVAASTPTGARLRRYLFQGGRPAPEDALPLVRALGGQEVQSEEFDIVFPNGKRTALLFSAAPIYDGEGRIAGAVSAFADITTQKVLQRELEIRRREAEEASVRKTRFLAAVSHDIRTPVNAINLMAEIIRRIAGNPTLAVQIPEMARKLQANALALVELVSDVLDLARFDAGKAEIQETEFRLQVAIDEECRQLLPLAQDKGLTLTFEHPPRPIWVRTDRVKLGRIVGNLVGNAIKFTERGRVEVKVGVDPDRRVLIQVRDTGVGIPAEHLARVFDEFAQLHNPERDRSKGTGLGLAICKRLVELLGGSLTAESTPGEGSTFTVILPAETVVLRLDTASPAEVSQSELGPALAERLAGLRLLLVEDHAVTRESTAQILRGEGATVLEAPDGRSALELIAQDQAEVLLLDMMLPDMDGREVLKQIQADRPPGLKAVLVLTGDLTAERLEEVKRLGADALIGKPIDIQQLVATLRIIPHTGPAG